MDGYGGRIKKQQTKPTNKHTNKQTKKQTHEQTKRKLHIPTMTNYRMKGKLTD